MTDTTDIVQRLRAMAEDVASDLEWCDEAADTITELRERVAELERAVSDAVMRDTMIRDIRINGSALNMQLEGGAASLLAEMLAKQYADGGGVNYMEVSFVSRNAVPGVAFVVTVQRVAGKTPHQFRSEAEAKVAELEKDAARFAALALYTTSDKPGSAADKAAANRFVDALDDAVDPQCPDDLRAIFDAAIDEAMKG